jgi:surface protein
MKRILLIGWILMLFVSSARAQDFITTWRILNNSSFIAFGAETVGPVNYSWQTLPPAAPASGSGTFTGPNVTISGLPITGSIRLTIQPQNFRRIVNNATFNFSYTLENINQWGAVPWTSMENAFRFYPELQVSAIDFPNLANVTSMAGMFEGCFALNSPFNINFWNISNVTNLSRMFKDCQNFNQALSLWNTANVTDMSSLFENAFAFNQNIGNWNTANVTSFRRMFKAANEFNRNIGNWNTGNVTDMSEMFAILEFASFPMQFNQNIGNWNTANVTTMAGMFYGASFFNQNISNWNTSNVTDMSDMFREANAFNQNIGGWNTSNVTTMARMFQNDLLNLIPENFAFNNGGNSSIQNWNTANVVDMSGMFSRAANFNFSLGNWVLNPNVVLVNMLDRSGLDCESYTQTLLAWNANPNTPNNKILGATFMSYGPEAIPAITNLVVNKGWGFSGHDFFSITPEFSLNNSYCEGDVIPALPLFSENGITGVWSPALNNTQTTTYTFIPNTGQCATSSSITLTIVPTVTPSGEANQLVSAGSTLNALSITPQNVLWYASLQDAQSGNNPLPLSTLLADGATYYAVAINSGCRSVPFAVTVAFSLDVASSLFSGFSFQPNPVTTLVTVANSTTMEQLEVYNYLGQKVRVYPIRQESAVLDMSGLEPGVYVIKVHVNQAVKTLKMLKR